MAALPALKPGVLPTLPVAQGCARSQAYLRQARLPGTLGAGPGTGPAASFTFIFAFPVMTEEPRKAVSSKQVLALPEPQHLLAQAPAGHRPLLAAVGRVAAVAPGLRMSVPDASKPLDEELYSRQL